MTIILIIYLELYDVIEYFEMDILYAYDGVKCHSLKNCLVSDFEKLMGSFGPCFQPIIAFAERFASCPRWGGRWMNMKQVKRTGYDYAVIKLWL